MNKMREDLRKATTIVLSYIINYASLTCHRAYDLEHSVHTLLESIELRMSAEGNSAHYSLTPQMGKEFEQG